MISREVAAEVGKLVGHSLREHFKDEFVFDPIVVQPAIDHDGDEYLDIFIIYEGDYKKLDPRWTVGLTVRLREELLALGVNTVCGHSFVPKDEWKGVFKEKHPKAYEPSSPY